MEARPGSTEALRVETSLEDSTELWILLARGRDDVDHRTAEVGLTGLDAEFSLPAAAAVVRRADEEMENGFGVSGREAVAVAEALPPPPPRSLRRDDMAGWRCRARVWGIRGDETRGKVALIWIWEWSTDLRFGEGAFQISNSFGRELFCGPVVPCTLEFAR